MTITCSRRSVVLATLIAVAGGLPASAASWQQVWSDNPTLWYDAASTSVDDMGFLTLSVYRGAWTDPEVMSANAIGIAVDCEFGFFDTWNPWTETWEETEGGLANELEDLALDLCGW